jgi:hypothetical protein
VTKSRLAARQTKGAGPEIPGRTPSWSVDDLVAT